MHGCCNIRQILALCVMLATFNYLPLTFPYFIVRALHCVCLLFLCACLDRKVAQPRRAARISIECESTSGYTFTPCVVSFTCPGIEHQIQGASKLMSHCNRARLRLQQTAHICPCRGRYQLPREYAGLLPQGAHT